TGGVALPERTVNVPVSDRNWGQAVAAQVQWLAGQGVKAATLRLSPEHLGPVEVRIDVHNSQVNVSFSAAHADTRTALEQAVPRLRELLGSSGLSLGQANVQQETRSGTQNGTPRTLGQPATVEDIDVAPRQLRAALGLVDAYA
ncbi:MAG: flagellar hook-length control protein FliK, partial [Steroidobacterales bacterium]